MRVFIKCAHCGHVVYTTKLDVLSRLEDLYCSKCEHTLDLVNVLLCTRNRGSWCDDCQFRFQCFSSEPFEGLDK